MVRPRHRTRTVGSVAVQTTAARSLDETTALKAKVAACCRLLTMEGILNYSGHVSARLPGRNAFLIHPLMESRAEVRAEDVLVCDLDCRVLSDSTVGEPPLETFIHAEIYRARSDVHSVVHTHSELAVFFTIARTKLLAMKQHAVRWKSGVPIHADPTHIKTPEQGRALAATLAQHNAALLRAHGGVIVAESVEAALVDCVHFDENARAQIGAAQLGELLPLTAEEIEALTRRSNRDQHVAKLWSYYVRRGLAAGVLEVGEVNGIV